MMLTLRLTSDIAHDEGGNVDNSALFNRCEGAYAHIERIFEDTPEKVSNPTLLAASIRRRSTSRATVTIDPPRAVPSILGHIGLSAQREPDVSRRDTRRESIVGRHGNTGKIKILQHRQSATTELAIDGAQKLTTTH